MARPSISHPLVQNWGALVLQGAVAILFGLLFLFAPLTTLLVAVYLFAAFAIADGTLALLAIFSHEQATSGWLLALYGMLGIVIGVIAFAWPEMTAAFFLTLVVVWALLIGIFRIAAALALRRELEGEWLLGLSGVLAVLFGLFVLFVPGTLPVLVLALGIFAILKGFSLIAAGFRLRAHMEVRRPETGGGPGPTEGPAVP